MPTTAVSATNSRYTPGASSGSAATMATTFTPMRLSGVSPKVCLNVLALRVNVPLTEGCSKTITGTTKDVVSVHAIPRITARACPRSESELELRRG